MTNVSLQKYMIETKQIFSTQVIKQIIVWRCVLFSICSQFKIQVSTLCFKPHCSYGKILNYVAVSTLITIQNAASQMADACNKNSGIKSNLQLVDSQ